MELREPIDQINERLLQEFGTEFGNSPRYRVVFSDDQYEKRWTTYTDEGFELLEREVRLLPKYKQYIRAKYVLEMLIPVPEGDTDLLTKVTYEPLWVFQDKKGNYLPPFFEGCKFVVEGRMEQMGKAGCFTKYKDKSVSKEEYMARIDKMQEELFGNESDVTDALHYGAGVAGFHSTIPTVSIKSGE